VIRQPKIFYSSILPSVTLALLTVQPLMANTAKEDEFRLFTSSDFSTFTDSGTLLANNVNRLPVIAVSDNALAPIVPKDSTGSNFQPLSNNSTDFALSGKTALLLTEKTGTIPERVLNSMSIPNPIQWPNQQSFYIEKEKKTNTLIAYGTGTGEIPSQAFSVPFADRLATLIARLNEKTPSANSLETSDNASPTPTKKVEEVAQLLEKGQFCSEHTDSKITRRSASLLLHPTTCNQKVASVGYQVTQPKTSTLITPVTDAQKDTQNLITPVSAAPQDTPPSVTQAPSTPIDTPPSVTPTPGVPKGIEPVPDYLDPYPNPLQFPTKPEEVKVVGAQPVTLDQALLLARRNNRQLQVALLELERSQAQLREERAALYPDISLTASLTRQQSAQSQLGVEDDERQLEEALEQPNLSDAQRLNLELQQQQLSPDQPSTVFSAGPQLTYDIYTSGARRARIEQAEEQVRLNQLQVEQLSEEVALNVSTQYYDLQQADQNVRIAQAAVTNAQASLRDAQALEQAGVGTRFDVLQAQVNLANAQQTLTNAVSTQRIAQRELANLLSLSQVVNITAADPVELAGLWKPTLEETIILAFQNRPELQQQLVQRNISQLQIREALAQLGPQLRLQAQYNLLDVFDDNVGITDGYTVALVASLVLYDGGQARAQAAQARTNVRISEVQFAQQRNNIRFEVEQAYSQLQSSLENVQTATAGVEQATEALRLARLRFQAGVGTQLEVINAENDLTTAQGNQIEAILDYNRALAQLRRAVTTRSLI
jgi:outer membrane protein TolC